MNPKSSPLGSIWRKWDLHFHTPASYDYGHKGATNQEIVDGLLKAGIEVVAITDHHRIDTARVLELQKLGGEDLTVLPGIELRSELGGSDSVHFIGIFPEDSDLVDLWTKLSGKLNITEAEVAKRGDDTIYCPFVETANVIHELGGLVTVHAGKKSNSIEGLKNTDYIKQIIKKDLVRECIDIYEVGDATDIQSYLEKVFPHLDRPIPLILCSDNHDIRGYSTKCPLWIKGDKSFEALRQTLFEPSCRVGVTPDKPLKPLLRVDRVTLDFPAETELVSEFNGEERRDAFCFRGKAAVVFSPYLTCLIGGRGSGKSTLLNLIHEKLERGQNKFFAANHLAPQPDASVATCVQIDGDTAKKVVEFLQQNEIEGFATDPWRFTEAVFSRLVKRDEEGKLNAVNAELAAALSATAEQAKRLQEHTDLVSRLADAEKELVSKKALIASFQNEEYKRINDEMGKLSQELQGLRIWRERLEALKNDLNNLPEHHSHPISENPNGYEKEFLRILGVVQGAVQPPQPSAEMAAAASREADLNGQVAALKEKLDAFLRGRGLSQENLADVGKANQRAAQLEHELPSLKARTQTLAAQISAFRARRDLPEKYSGAVQALLAPINNALRNLSKEVKQIELHYEFDYGACRQTLIEHIQDVLGDAGVRIDHVESMLQDVDLFRLDSREKFLQRISDAHKTGKAIRECYSIPLRFDLLRIEVERQLLEVGGFGRFRVLYDKKPVENTSFGQRCTAAIVVLLILGNTPIVIDEPEAHLDSALIANYLVELVKSKKVNRQIIFATHNANFVVNGDAELIHILEMGDDKQSKIVSTTIEDLSHRSELLRLEGGPEAFLKREHRYGIA
ncbi:MAG: AAA family ATPase [Verrucomicrobia bacterium]|nr:AAA family ATPase [Verrucomicrobiota bacterium]